MGIVEKAEKMYPKVFQGTFDVVSLRERVFGDETGGLRVTAAFTSVEVTLSWLLGRLEFFEHGDRDKAQEDAAKRTVYATVQTLCKMKILDASEEQVLTVARLQRNHFIHSIRAEFRENDLAILVEACKEQGNHPIGNDIFRFKGPEDSTVDEHAKNAISILLSIRAHIQSLRSNVDSIGTKVMGHRIVEEIAQKLQIEKATGSKAT